MTILCVHSSGLSGRQWGYYRRLLADTIITPDLHGYPDGPTWSGGVAMAEDLRYLEGLVDDHEGPLDLIGHSYGGALAFKLARSRPGRIRRLVVHDPVLWGPLLSNGSEETKNNLKRFVAQGMIDEARAGTESWMRDFIAYWGGPGAFDALNDARREAFLSVGRKVFAEVRDLAIDRTSLADFAAVTIPVLVATSEQSPKEQHEVTRLLTDDEPQRTLVVLSGDHMSPVKDPKAFCAHIDSFFASYPTGG